MDNHGGRDRSVARGQCSPAAAVFVGAIPFSKHVFKVLNRELKWSSEVNTGFRILIIIIIEKSSFCLSSLFLNNKGIYVCT